MKRGKILKIYVVGAGVGDERYLTGYALEKIQKAQMLVTTKRLCNSLGHLNKNSVCKEIGQIAAFIKENVGKIADVCILVSGDTGFFSIGKMLKTQLAEFEMQFINGLSSFQFLAARLQTSYDDMKLLSGHGRDVNIVPNVCYNKKVFLLTGGNKKAHDFIRELNDAGLKDVIVTVGENLSENTERIITDTVQNLLCQSFCELSVMIVQNDKFVSSFEKVTDKDFIRSNVPMTKDAIRILSISKLDIKPYDNVIDVGAGTGSVAIGLARAASEGYVLALEQKQEALDLIKLNREKLRAYNVIVKKALAPDGLDDFKADKAFVGGSSGNLKEIINTLVDKNGCKKIVVNAITLETLQEATTAFKNNNMNTDICCINVAQSEQIGSYNMMKAQNPVYIISGEIYE